MKRLVFLALLLSASAASAAPTTYKFEGTLSGAFAFSPNSAWAFAQGQKFSGTVVWDPEQILFEGYRIDQPDWTMRTFHSPIVSFNYRIETPAGYAHDVPTQNLSDNAITRSQIAKGPGGWNGVALDMLNYPKGWRSNPPSATLPDSAYVGSWAPHNVYMSLANGDPTTLAEITPDLDLAAVFAKTGGNFYVRFSDPFAWSPGVEHIDGVLDGRIESFARVAAVPEPATWAMMIGGFALAGGVARRKSATRIASAA